MDWAREPLTERRHLAAAHSWIAIRGPLELARKLGLRPLGDLPVLAERAARIAADGADGVGDRARQEVKEGSLIDRLHEICGWLPRMGITRLKDSRLGDLRLQHSELVAHRSCEVRERVSQVHHEVVQRDNAAQTFRVVHDDHSAESQLAHSADHVG